MCLNSMSHVVINRLDLDRNLWVSAGKKQDEKLVLNIKKLQKNYFLIIGEGTSTCEVNFESLNCIRSKLAHHTRENVSGIIEN